MGGFIVEFWSFLRVRKIVRPFIPIGVLDLKHRYNNARVRRQSEARRRRLIHLKGNVLATIEAIRNLTPSQCSDVDFLEKAFIPMLGLNDELLYEQPPELSEYYGRGLHIWQYPNQLAPYLCWLAQNAAEIDSYIEIGCRWGGTLILVTEWLRKNGANIRTVIAVDPIEPSPFIDEYSRFLNNEIIPENKKVKLIYVPEFSVSDEVRKVVNEIKPTFAFLDGGHHLRAALADYLLVRDYADIIVHHDIKSQACQENELLWGALRTFENANFDFHEFVDQYDSVDGSFLGIGVMKRKILPKG